VIPSFLGNRFRARCDGAIEKIEICALLAGDEEFREMRDGMKRCATLLGGFAAVAG
jgi:hypothetical protein